MGSQGPARDTLCFPVSPVVALDEPAQVDTATIA
jgi:hypothetical protein